MLVQSLGKFSSVTYMKSFHKNISKICNTSVVLENIEQKFQSVKKWDNSYGFWKINSFGFISNEKRIGALIKYWKIIIFYQFFKNS